MFFTPPDLPTNNIVRKELFSALSGAPEQFLYLYAPAGFGKTIATAGWVRIQPAQNAWIALDEYADTPHRFFRSFLEALCQIQKTNHRLFTRLDKMEHTALPLDILLESLPLLSINSEPCILVLDDWHYIRDEQVHKGLSLVLRRLPKNWRVLLLSRQGPQGDLADLALKGEMAVFTADALKFQAGEVRQLFQKSSQPLTEQQAQDILDETGGWAIAVNARRVGNHRFGGEEKSLFDNYLDSQLWRLLEKKDQELLIKTSVTEELSPSFCHAVTGLSDSKKRLEALCRQNLFISSLPGGNFRLHPLFQKYLTGKFEEYPPHLQQDIFDRAGHWHLDHADHFTAMAYFARAKNITQLSHCLQKANEYTVSSDIEWRMVFMQRYVFSLLDHAFIRGNLSLVRQSAWFHFLAGDAAGFEADMDTIYPQLPGVQDPRTQETLSFLTSLDYRVPAGVYMQSLKAALAQVSLPSSAGQAIQTATITINLPYAHRSMRDYSECANDLEPFLSLSKDSIGKLLGKEYNALEDAIRAGIHYEQNDLDTALRFAQKAMDACAASSSPEIIFSANTIFMVILRAQNDELQAQRVEVAIEEMLEKTGALYLEPNYLALLCEKHIRDGSRRAAENWLARYNTDTGGLPALYQMHLHFTTAQAFLATGRYEDAIHFLHKVERLAHAFHRPLDSIQTNILLSIAYWQNHEQKHARASMKLALKTAQPFGFTRIFLNETQTVVTHIFQSLLNSARSDQADPGYLHFLRSISISRTGDRGHGTNRDLPSSPLPLSGKQKEVLSLMSEGLTYVEIAQRLDIQYSTVKSHVKKLFEKLNVNSFEAAVLAARQAEPAE